MTDAGISVSLLCVVQERHTRNVLDVVQWIKELGLSVRFNPLLARGRSGESLPPHAYFQFLRDAFTLCCEYSVGARVEPVSWMIENVIFGRPATECSFGGACGRSILAFFPDGGVGPCVRSKTRYGNIHDKETSLSEMWRGRARSELLGRGERLEKFCGGCRARMGCNGGCPAVNGDSPSAGDCAERRDFFGWLSQEGVALLQGTLVKEKSRLKEKAAILQKARKTLAGGRDV
jgi:radical SAM protein with 4Fe4S-binding SPASM domain